MCIHIIIIIIIIIIPVANRVEEGSVSMETTGPKCP